MDAPVSALASTTPEKHVASRAASFLLRLVPVGRERFKGMGGLDEVMARRSCLWGKRLLRASRFLEGEAVAKKPERSSKYQSHHDGLFRAAFNKPDALRCEAEVVLPPSVVRTLDFSRVDMLTAASSTSRCGRVRVTRRSASRSTGAPPSSTCCWSISERAMC